MDKKIKWYKRKELIGGIISVLSLTPDLINWAVASDFLPEYTLLAKLAFPIGIVLSAIGLRRGYQSNNLPSGITRVMDKLPANMTGYRDVP